MKGKLGFELSRISSRSLKSAWLIVLVMFSLSGWVIWCYLEQGIKINTNPMALLSPDLPFQKVDAALAKEFPANQRKLVLVIDGEIPEAVDIAVHALIKRLKAHPAFERVEEPMRGPFFEKHGLLYQSTADLNELAPKLSRAQPLFGQLNSELSIASLCTFLTLALPNMNEAQLNQASPLIDGLMATYEDIKPLTAADATDASALSWQRVLFGSETAVVTRLLAVYPRLDYGKVLSAGKSVRALREVIGALETESIACHWTSDKYNTLKKPRIGLSGDAALSHEEMKTVVRGMKWGGPLSLGMVLVVLLIGFKSLRYVAVTLISLLIGLTLTAGAAWLFVGRLNMISIAFAMLYVGLGVDFALHFLFHLRENHDRAAGSADKSACIAETVRQMTMPLLLCALTTALGFFSFAPTAYTGVSELGVIAGSGMIISWFVTLFLAPAMMRIMGAGTKSDRAASYPKTHHGLTWPQRYRKMILVMALLAAAISSIYAGRVDFNADPIALRDQASESVLVTRYLLGSGDRNRHRISLIAQDQRQLEQVVEAFKQVDSIDRVISLKSLVPKNQTEKLEMIEELALLMGLGFMMPEEASVTAKAASPIVNHEKDALAIAKLLEAVEGVKYEKVQALSLLFQDVLNWEDGKRKMLAESWLKYFPLAHQRLVSALTPETVTMASIPDNIKKQWVSKQGKWLLTLIPKADVTDNQTLSEFITSVTAVTEHVSGGPVRRHYARKAIVQSFQMAFIYAFAGIVIILLIELKNLAHTLLVLLPLLLGGGMTLTAMVLLDIDFNFANVIALPLLLGIGVDSGIHMVHQHVAREKRERAKRQKTFKEETDPVLDTSHVTVKAIFLSCLTTLCSFGNLGFSPHPGTASMGQVLTIGTFAMLVCTLVLLPALMQRKAEIPKS